MKKLSYLVLLLLAFTACDDEVKEPAIAEVAEEKPAPAIVKEYGFVLNNFETIKDVVKSGDNFGDILIRNGLSPAQVYQIVQGVKDTFDPRKIVIGKPYAILRTKDSIHKPYAFIYENDKINYTVIKLGDSISAYQNKKPVKFVKKTVSGVINSSLSNAIQEAGINYAVTNELSAIYQWSIDFFRLQKGDKFKLVYDEKYINDTIYAGIDKIEASVFVHGDKPYYAFGFVADSVSGRPDFYDENGRPLESFFLKAPLDFTRISSRYSPRRFHPIQKRWKAHKGTDYAAPTGTPIWSTANGVVIASSYTSGNGNYVKVRHNATYTTQYLHMSKRNIKKGQHVKQGDVIGFVGSTGLATGPHVCYRFWMNGKQVDPFRQNLPDAEPIKDDLIDDYFVAIEPLKEELSKIEFKQS